MVNRALLARKYARAFLNVVGTTISGDDITHIEHIISFLKDHKQALFFLKLSYITNEVKRDALHALFAQVPHKEAFHKLIRILLDDNRGYLIYPVLEELVDIYDQMHHITSFTITSSHILSHQDLEEIRHFLTARIGGDIVYTYHQDPSLIAGIRLQSNTLLWEHSIRKQLRALTAHMALKG